MIKKLLMLMLLASPSIAQVRSYNVCQDEGTPLAQEPAINFVGTPVTCVDDAINRRTTCTVTSPDLSGYALLAGRAGGQTLKGGTATGETLTLQANAIDTGSFALGNGSILISDNTLLKFGVASGAYPALRRSGNELEVTDANGTGMRRLYAYSHNACSGTGCSLGYIGIEPDRVLFQVSGQDANFVNNQTANFNFYGGTNKSLRVYTLDTSLTANYERLTLTGVNGTSVDIKAETAGIGADNLNINLTPSGTGNVSITTGGLLFSGCGSGCSVKGNGTSPDRLLVSPAGDVNYGLEVRNQDNKALLWLGNAAGFAAETTGTMGQRAGATQQTLRIYNTSDNSFSSYTNYERMALTGVAGTSVDIKAETAGTGADNLSVVLTPAGTGTNDLSAGIKIPTGTGPTVDSTHNIGIDTTADQLLIYGGALKAIPTEYCTSSTVDGLKAADDNFPLAMYGFPVTITKVGCAYEGTGTTPATIALEDNSGNACTHTAPTCVTSTTSATYQSVTSCSLVAGERLRMDVTNAVSPETDKYVISWCYTVDRQ